MLAPWLSERRAGCSCITWSFRPITSRTIRPAIGTSATDTPVIRWFAETAEFCERYDQNSFDPCLPDLRPRGVRTHRAALLRGPAPAPVTGRLRGPYSRIGRSHRINPLRSINLSPRSTLQLDSGGRRMGAATLTGSTDDALFCSQWSGAALPRARKRRAASSHSWTWSSGADWALQVPALERRFRLIMPDLPGSGHSAPLRAGMQHRRLAAALWALCDIWAAAASMSWDSRWAARSAWKWRSAARSGAPPGADQQSGNLSARSLAQMAGGGAVDDSDSAGRHAPRVAARGQAAYFRCRGSEPCASGRPPR